MLNNQRLMTNQKNDSLKKERGYSTPLGVSRREDGLNFALFSEHASGVTLCLFLPHSSTPLAEIVMDPEVNRTGWVWHSLIKGLPTDELEYGYRVSGPKEDPRGRTALIPKRSLSDPYAQRLSTGNQWGNKEEHSPRGERVILDTPFDWGDEKPPGLHPEKLVIYEMHVRGFTKDPSSHSKAPGTYQGIVEKIPYLRKFGGPHAIELMPMFEFNECENKRTSPKGEKLVNMW